MSNELSKAIKRKTDAQFRTMGEDRSPSVSEGADGSVVIVDPSVYTIPYVAGKNIFIGTSGSNKVINALMNILAGDNITVTEPDENGAVTISANIGGKEIDLTGLADGYALTYDAPSDSFILAEMAGSITQATETELGGVKAKARTSESAEVAIDETTGKLYAPESGGSELTQATETILGGVRAKEKTTESSEVAIDSATGKLFAPAPGQATNGLPAGGTAGQVLAKVDGTDFNAEWIDVQTGSHPTYGTLLKAQDIYDVLFGTLQKTIVPNVNVSPDIVDALFVTCPLGQSQTSQLTFSSDGGAFNVWYAYQTEGGYDFVAMWLDDILIGEWSGTNMSGFYTINLSAGLHTFKIRYRQDGSRIGGWGGCRLYAISYL